jgi:hypothetical protein
MAGPRVRHIQMILDESFQQQHCRVVRCVNADVSGMHRRKCAPTLEARPPVILDLIAQVADECPAIYASGGRW